VLSAGTSIADDIKKFENLDPRMPIRDYLGSLVRGSNTVRSCSIFLANMLTLAVTKDRRMLCTSRQVITLLTNINNR
jgi:hypothetical protein